MSQVRARHNAGIIEESSSKKKALLARATRIPTSIKRDTWSHVILLRFARHGERSSEHPCTRQSSRNEREREKKRDEQRVEKAGPIEQPPGESECSN